MRDAARYSRTLRDFGQNGSKLTWIFVTIFIRMFASFFVNRIAMAEDGRRPLHTQGQLSGRWFGELRLR
jgi:hypothetical protein